MARLGDIHNCLFVYEFNQHYLNLLYQHCAISVWCRHLFNKSLVKRLYLLNQPCSFHLKHVLIDVQETLSPQGRSLTLQDPRAREP